MLHQSCLHTENFFFFFLGSIWRVAGAAPMFCFYPYISQSEGEVHWKKHLKDHAGSDPRVHMHKKQCYSACALWYDFY